MSILSGPARSLTILSGPPLLEPDHSRFCRGRRPPARVRCGSIGAVAVCPTLLSGPSVQLTPLSGPPLLTRDSVGAAAPDLRFCRGRWRRCAILSGPRVASSLSCRGHSRCATILSGSLTPLSRFYRGVGAGAARPWLAILRHSRMLENLDVIGMQPSTL